MMIPKDFREKWLGGMGSYRLIDNGNGTYNSFGVYWSGKVEPLSKNKSFNQEDLQSEIDEGRLVLQDCQKNNYQPEQIS